MEKKVIDILKEKSAKVKAEIKEYNNKMLPEEEQPTAAAIINHVVYLKSINQAISEIEAQK